MKHCRKWDNPVRIAAITFAAAMAWLTLPQPRLDRTIASDDVRAGQSENPATSADTTKDRSIANLLGPNTSTLILYDQTDNVGLVSSASQNFGPSNPFNSEAADDFLVPPGRIWTIQQLNVLG